MIKDEAKAVLLLFFIPQLKLRTVDGEGLLY